jgi:hypothetical protein
VNEEVEAVIMNDPLTNESRDLPVIDSNAIIIIPWRPNFGKKVPKDTVC